MTMMAAGIAAVAVLGVDVAAGVDDVVDAVDAVDVADDCYCYCPPGYSNDATAALIVDAVVVVDHASSCCHAQRAVVLVAVDVVALEHVDVVADSFHFAVGVVADAAACRYCYCCCFALPGSKGKAAAAGEESTTIAADDFVA